MVELFMYSIIFAHDFESGSNLPRTCKKSFTRFFMCFFSSIKLKSCLNKRATLRKCSNCRSNPFHFLFIFFIPKTNSVWIQFKFHYMFVSRLHQIRAIEYWMNVRVQISIVFNHTILYSKHIELYKFNVFLVHVNNNDVINHCQWLSVKWTK